MVGPGGIGGTFAALLARSGACNVTLLGRPGAHVEALRRDGLALEGLDEFTVDVEALDDPTRVKACDALIYAVKAQDTEAATSHGDVRVLATSLQNGVVKDEQLAATFGAERVVGALTVVAGERPEPGVGRHRPAPCPRRRGCYRRRDRLRHRSHSRSRPGLWD